MNEQVRLIREFYAVAATREPETVPDIACRFLAGIAAYMENDLVLELDSAHSRRVDDVHEIGIAGKYNANYTTVFDLDFGEPIKLLQYQWISRMCIVNDQQDMIAGDAAANEKLLCDVTELIRRARNVLESDLRQKRTVKLHVTMTAFIDDNGEEVVVEAADVTVD